MFGIEKFVNENGDKVTEEEKDRLKKAADELKEALKSDNKDTIKTALDDTQKVTSEIFTKFYQQNQQQAPDAEGGVNPDDIQDDPNKQA